ISTAGRGVGDGRIACGAAETVLRVHRCAARLERLHGGIVLAAGRQAVLLVERLRAGLERSLIAALARSCITAGRSIGDDRIACRGAETVLRVHRLRAGLERSLLAALARSCITAGRSIGDAPIARRGADADQLAHGL